MSSATLPDVSIVVPLYNEEACVGPLVEAVRNALGTRFRWELVLVDDGSRDTTAARALALADGDDRVRLVRLARNYGQTPATQAGFDHARAPVVVTMDGDLQNDPLDIPMLLETLETGYDLVAGYRLKRQDGLLLRKVPSWVANRIIRRVTGVAIRDNGCSLKAYRRPVLERLRLYSDMHRFIPALAVAIAGARVAEVPVRHHPRRLGTSKYGLGRVLRVAADLGAITAVRSFRARPLRLFARTALVAFGLGLVTLAAAVYAALTFGPAKVNAVVLPGAALLWIALAAYLLLLGLITELAVRVRTRGGGMALPLVQRTGGAA